MLISSVTKTTKLGADPVQKYFSIMCSKHSDRSKTFLSSQSETSVNLCRKCLDRIGSIYLKGMTRFT